MEGLYPELIADPAPLVDLGDCLAGFACGRPTTRCRRIVRGNVESSHRTLKVPIQRIPLKPVLLAPLQ